jgi:hypothetical protein
VKANEKKVRAEAKKVKAEVRVVDAHIMMMDPSGLDAMAREFWEMQRAEIMRGRREEHQATMFGDDDHGAMDGGQGREYS